MEQTNITEWLRTCQQILLDDGPLSFLLVYNILVPAHNLLLEQYRSSYRSSYTSKPDVPDDMASMLCTLFDRLDLQSLPRVRASGWSKLAYQGNMVLGRHPLFLIHPSAVVLHASVAFGLIETMQKHVSARDTIRREYELLRQVMPCFPKTMPQQALVFNAFKRHLPRKAYEALRAIHGVDWSASPYILATTLLDMKHAAETSNTADLTLPTDLFFPECTL